MIPVTKKPQQNYSSRYFISKDIQKMFYPLHLMQKIFLSPKYGIKNDVIHSNGTFYTTVVIFFMVLVTGIWSYDTYCHDFFATLGMKRSRMYTMMLATFFCYSSCSIVSLYISNAMQNSTYIILLLKIQFVHENYSVRGVESFVVWNWLSNVLIIFIKIILIASYFISHHYFNLLDAFMNLFFVTFDIHLIYYMRIMMLLKLYLINWNYDVLIKACEETDEFWVKMINFYTHIMEVYDVYRKLFQMLVIIRSGNLICHTLCYVEIQLEAVKSDFEGFSYLEYLVMMGVLIAWLAKDIVLDILATFYCEQFYILVEDTETTCLLLLNTANYSEKGKQLFKNIYRLNKTYFNKVNVFGLFDVEAALSLSFMSLLTNYVIVLLQFAFV